jgi:hypothetical protein
MKRAIAIAVLPATAALFTPTTHAAVLLDQSPATTDAAILTDNLDNRAGGQNFAEDFSFASAVSLEGMDIYMKSGIASVGQSVTIRVFEDVAGVPGSKLFDFTETIDSIDSTGASATTERIYAEFTTPLSLDAGVTYWIGMSGTTETLKLAGLGDVSGTTSPYDDSVMAQYSDEALVSVSGFGSGDMAFRLHGVVPEPASIAILAGLGLVTHRRRGR